MDDVNCPECGTEDWDFASDGRAQCANGHEWDQAPDPAFPGTFMRPWFPGDVNDPDRFPGGEGGTSGDSIAPGSDEAMEDLRRRAAEYAVGDAVRRRPGRRRGRAPPDDGDPCRARRPRAGRAGERRHPRPGDRVAAWRVSLVAS
jgi:hypothetical protein